MTPETSNAATAFEPPVAVFDACILYPFRLRNIVVQVAADQWVQARWTDEIHDEWILKTLGLRCLTHFSLIFTTGVPTSHSPRWPTHAEISASRALRHPISSNS